MWQLLSALRSHPFVASLLTAFAVVSAFMGGAVANVGLAFLPIVDKLDVLILLTFYISLLSVVIYLLRGSYDLFARYVELARAVLASTFKTVRPDMLRLPAPVAVLVRFASIALIVLVALILVYRSPLVSELSTIPSAQLLAYALGVIVALGIGYLAVRTFDSGPTPVLLGIRAVSISASLVSAVVAAFAAGVLWIDLLRERGPRVDIRLANASVSLPATIALPATEGIVVFYPGDEKTHYLPWSRIEAISAREPPLPLVNIPALQEFPAVQQ